jgi:YopX protein
MRDIQFRAWNKSKKQMVKSIYAHFDKQGILHGSLTILGDTYIPLQYTGLKDKKGKGIYEGDIINFVDLYGHKHRGFDVQFKNGVFTPFHVLEVIRDGKVDCEVIGNIWFGVQFHWTPSKV